jgi:hypothetical protein
MLVYLQQYHSVEHAQPSTWPGALEPQTLTIGAVQRVRVAPLTHDETCVSHVCKCFTCILIYLPRYNCMEHARPPSTSHINHHISQCFDLDALHREAVVCTTHAHTLRWLCIYCLRVFRMRACLFAAMQQCGTCTAQHTHINPCNAIQARVPRERITRLEKKESDAAGVQSRSRLNGFKQISKVLQQLSSVITRFDAFQLSSAGLLAARVAAPSAPAAARRQRSSVAVDAAASASAPHVTVPRGDEAGDSDG